MLRLFVGRRRQPRIPPAAWAILPVPLLAVGQMLGTWSPPGQLPEPEGPKTLLRPPVLFTPDGDGYRAVPFDQRKGVAPLWTATLAARGRSEITRPNLYVLPGLFRQHSEWTYTLGVSRFDTDPGPAKVFVAGPTAADLRPKVVAELNARDPAARRGDELEKLLADGQSETSYGTWQNLVVVLGWLSLVPAAVAVWQIMRGKQQRPPAGAGGR